MRLPLFFQAGIIATCLFTLQFCSKNDGSTPNPAPIVKPDTLSAGWTKVALDKFTFSQDIFFNSLTTGYLGTSGYSYKSTDGGLTWTKLDGGGGNWINLFVTNDGKLFCTNNNPVVVRTVDGGLNYTFAYPYSAFADLFFIDNNTGFGIGTEGSFYNTIDGGITWTRTVVNGLPVSNQYVTLTFVNNTTGWVVNQMGVYKSVGSFLNWQQSVINGGSGGSSTFTSIYAVSASNIYLANSNSEIFKSTNGGVSFSFAGKLDIATSGFRDIHFINDQVGYACAGRYIFKTSDGGINWSKVVSMGENGFSEIHFLDANHGWVCGQDQVLIFKQ